MNEIGQNLQKVRDRIAAAAMGCGRHPEEITLVAVSKNFSEGHILAAVAAGQSHFGENRVQEAESKIPQIRSASSLTWHMIGHLQSNKAHLAAELFDFIHSVDSVKLARKLGQAACDLGKSLSVLIQADLGHEQTKFGAEPGLIREITLALLEMEGLSLEGLMTIPPFFADPERTRPYFSALRELRDTLEREKPGCLGKGHLSMGMSHDFEIAIAEGATIVRVGTAIFGERSRG